MKAIRKEDGKEIEVSIFSSLQYIEETGEVGTAMRRIYLPESLIVDTPVDWETYRREAIKDFLAAIVMREAPRTVPYRNVPLAVDEAIMWANELIRRLKEEKQ